VTRWGTPPAPPKGRRGPLCAAAPSDGHFTRTLLFNLCRNFLNFSVPQLPKREEPGKTGRHPVLKYRVPHGSQPRPGWAPDPLMVGIRSPDGLVVGSCTSHPGVLGSFPKREEPGKTGRRPVLKYRVPHGSQREQLCNRYCSKKHTPRIRRTHFNYPPGLSPLRVCLLLRGDPVHRDPYHTNST
jgi:hypothetical protein